jgi:hypothetical protein
MLLNKSKYSLLYKIITPIIIHAIILSNIAWAVPKTDVSTLAPPTMFSPIVKRVNGFRKVISIQGKEVEDETRKVRFAREALHQKGLMEYFRIGMDTSSTERNRMAFICREVLSNSFDAIIDRIDELEETSDFEGKIIIEAYLEGEEAVIKIIDNGKTIEFEVDGRTPIKRLRDSNRHFSLGGSEHGRKGEGIPLVHKDIKSLGGKIDRIPFRNGTLTEIRIPKERLPSDFIAENEYIFVENREEKRRWEEETVRAVTDEGRSPAAWPAGANRMAFYYISMLIGQELHKPSTEFLANPAPETRAQAMIDEIKRHVSPAELALSRTHHDKLLAGFELDKLRYEPDENAYYLPIYRDGAEKFCYKFYIGEEPKNPDDWTIPLGDETNVYVELESEVGKGMTFTIRLPAAPASPPTFRNFEELLEPYFASPSTGEIIDGTTGLQSDFLEYPATHTCNIDETAKSKRDHNLKWVVSNAPHKKTIVILCAGSVDYAFLENIEGIERIILVDIKKDPLKRAWQKIPDKLKKITYLLCANCNWIAPEFIERISRRIESSNTIEEAKKNVLELLRTDKNIWVRDRHRTFPEGYADIVIMEKAYTQMPIVMRNFIIQLIADRFDNRDFARPRDEEKEFWLELCSIIEGGLKPIIINEISRITNADGGIIYIGAMEYFPHGKFEPMERFIKENDEIYRLGEKATDISTSLPYYRWVDVESNWFGTRHGMRGFCYMKGKPGGVDGKEEITPKPASAETATPESEQAHSIEFAKAVDNTKPSFIALGTSWIEGYEKGRYLQYDALNPLISSIANFCTERKIPFICGDDIQVATEVRRIKGENPKARGIILAGEDMVNALGLNNDENVFLAGVNNENLTIDSYVPVMEMLSLLLRLLEAKTIDQEAIREEHRRLGIRFDPNKRRCIFFTLEAIIPEDYRRLKELYKVQRFV